MSGRLLQLCCARVDGTANASSKDGGGKGWLADVEMRENEKCRVTIAVMVCPEEGIPKEVIVAEVILWEGNPEAGVPEEVVAGCLQTSQLSIHLI